MPIKKFKPYLDRGPLYESAIRLRNEGHGYGFIAAQIGLSPSSVRNWVRHIKLRTPATPKWKERPVKPLEECTKARSRKRWLIKQRGRRCEKCRRSTWLSQLIALELHHEDGDKSNNEESNLKLLCPNCHATTKHYRGRNMKKFRVKVAHVRQRKSEMP